MPSLDSKFRVCRIAVTADTNPGLFWRCSSLQGFKTYLSFQKKQKEVPTNSGRENGTSSREEEQEEKIPEKIKCKETMMASSPLTLTDDRDRLSNITGFYLKTKMFNQVTYFLKLQLYSRIYPENTQQKNIKILGLTPVFDELKFCRVRSY